MTDTVYIVMKTVGLGGAPVSGFSTSAAAHGEAHELNQKYKETEYKALIKGGFYTAQSAKDWVANAPKHFYVESVSYYD